MKWLKKIMLGLSVLLLTCSVFKHLSYPLLWNDEAETIMHSESVLEYGFPKVHNGKNVIYPIRHRDKTIGIHEETDAYTGFGWVMFYFGTISVKLGEPITDIYWKTFLVRLPFALAGLIGTYVMAFSFLLFIDRKNRGLMFFLINLLLIYQLDYALNIREARYYALIIFISSFSVLTFAYYVKARLSGILYLLIQFPLLFLVYNTFAPIYMILGSFFGLYEISRIYQQRNIKQSIYPLLTLVLSAICLLPVILFFDTLNFSKATAELHHFRFWVYLFHLKEIFKYFLSFGYGWWILILGIIIGYKLCFQKSYMDVTRNEIKLLFGLLLVCLIHVLVIAYIPSFIFTRYMVLLLLFQVMLVSLMLHIGYKNMPVVPFWIVVLILSGIFILNRKEDLKGRISELMVPYRGPLDYEIPYIMDTFDQTENLVIATNYEECSYMYYLKSKVIMGFVLNNYEKDIEEVPDIIIFRHDWAWNYEKEAFEPFFERADYKRKYFPVYDYAYNNVTELNLNYGRHLFKTKKVDSPKDQASIFIKVGH